MGFPPSSANANYGGQATLYREITAHGFGKSATTSEWLKAVAQSARDTG
jgi:hypothetical protein